LILVIWAQAISLEAFLRNYPPCWFSGDNTVSRSSKLKTHLPELLDSPVLARFPITDHPVPLEMTKERLAIQLVT
jgi:hypothetical protein